MASPAQILANKSNAQRSTGPKTAEGKAASSRNAIRHGLTGATFAILPDENPAEYDELVAGLRAEYTPVGGTELFLVDLMAKSRWKLIRIERLEAEAFDEILEQDSARSSSGRVLDALSKPGCILDKLQRYAAAAERSYYKALRELEQSRARRQQAEATALENYIRKIMFAAVPGHVERKLYHAAVNDFNATGQSGAAADFPVAGASSV